MAVLFTPELLPANLISMKTCRNKLDNRNLCELLRNRWSGGGIIDFIYEVCYSILEMKKYTLYIETSLFGFYYDEKPTNREKRESVRKLFKQIAEGYYEGGFVSSVTLMELARTPEVLREKLLSLIPRHDLKSIEVDEDEVEKLTQKYINSSLEGMSIFKKWPDDARHIDMATVSGVDILVTLNCEHIANERTIQNIKEVNCFEGYSKELDIRRPEEVIFYEN